jgi:hypothetical protein
MKKWYEQDTLHAEHEYQLTFLFSTGINCTYTRRDRAMIFIMDF